MTWHALRRFYLRFGIAAAVLLVVSSRGFAQEQARPTETVTRQTEVYLGVVTEPVSEAVAAQLSRQLPAGKGLLVRRLLPGSPAEQAGVRPLDVIAATADQPVGSPVELKRRVTALQRGDSLRLSLVRAGEVQSLVVQLGERTVSTLTARHTPPGAMPSSAARLELALNDGTDVEQADGELPRTLHALTLRTRNGREFELNLTYLDERGESRTADLTGSVSTLRSTARTLPAPLQPAIERLLAVAEREKAQSQTVQFRCSPGQQGTSRTLQIAVRQPEANGSIRWFELERTVASGTGPTPLAQTLELPEVQTQLSGMDPAVRARIEQTIKTAALPPLSVRREESQ